MYSFYFVDKTVNFAQLISNKYRNNIFENFQNFVITKSECNLAIVSL